VENKESINLWNIYNLIIFCCCLGNNVYFQRITNKNYVLTEAYQIEPVARAVYESEKITRLDRVLNKLGIGQSKICHTEFPQKTENGKLLIQPCPLMSGAYDEAETMFNISINIWSCKRIDDREIWKRIRTGDPDKETQLNFHRNVDKTIKHFEFNSTEYIK